MPSDTAGELTAGDTDYFRLSVGDSGFLDVWTQGSTDTFGQLEDASGSRLASNNNVFAGTNFRIQHAVSAGTYYVRVTGSSRSVTGNYTLRVRLEQPTDDHGNSEPTATEVSVPSTTRGDLEESFDVDVFRFRLTAVGRLIVETTGGTDTGGAMLGPNGERWDDRNSGTGRNFRFVIDNAPAGVYYVAVKGQSPTNTGPYELHVSVGRAPPDDHGDTNDTATTVRVPSTTAGNLEESGDSDRFRFHLPFAGKLTVYTTGGTNTLGVLTIPFGSQVDNDDSGEGRNFRIERSNTPAGDYFVEVRGIGDSTGRYTLHVEATRDDHGDSAFIATSVSVPSTTGGNLERSDDRDWFTFRLSSPGRLTVHTTGGTDTTGYLRGPARARRDEDSGEGSNFRIVEDNAPAGIYEVEVRGRSGSTGRYELHVTFDPAPLPDDHGNTESTATEIRVPSTTRGNIQIDGDLDYFRFHLDSPGSLVVYTTGGTDTAGHLFGPGLGEFGELDEDSGAGENFRIVVDNASAGTYHATVRSLYLGPYELHVSFNPASSGNRPAPTGVRWQVTSPPDFLVDGRLCGRRGDGSPGPGIYLSWSEYPGAVENELEIRFANDAAPFWAPLRQQDPGGEVIFDPATETCVRIWNTRRPEIVDLRLRMIFPDGSRSDWAEILGIRFPANPSAAATAGMADQDVVANKAYRDEARKR